MNIETLQQILQRIRSVRAGIIGDFCIDIYWHADMTKSELSKETPHFPLPVIRETYAPGAAGNVAANIAALRPASLDCIGIKGDDWRGDLLDRAMHEKGIHSPLLVCKDRFTNAYCKPMRKGISEAVYEDPRLDFENYKPISKDTEELILSKLEQLSSGLDVLAVADQFQYGVMTDAIRKKLIEAADNGLKIIADSRYHIASYYNMFLKPNESECAAALRASTDRFEQNAKALAMQNHATVIETLGSKGSLITDGSYCKRIDAVKLTGKTDICGAGDTSLSALALSIGAGFNLMVCAEFAALASAVTVQKIGETGTASPEEILHCFQNCRL